MKKWPRSWLVLLSICILSVAIAACYFGLWIPNYPSERAYPVRGIDVSNHQGSIDWKAVQRSGTQFAYIKATEGADFKDQSFSTNWTQCGEARLVRGAYHFFTLGTSGKLQSANFIDSVPVDPAALPPAIDLEFSGYNKKQRSSPKDFQRELALFWDAIFAHYRKKPVVYTTGDFQKIYLAQMPVERLWVRDVIVTPGQAWTFWQFSPRGWVSGVPTFVDLNVFRGSPADFQTLIETERD